VCLDEDDVAARVALLGDDGGPQAVVTAANDAQVADLTAYQRGIAIGFVGVVVPVRVRICIGYRVEVEGIELRVLVVGVERHGVTISRRGAGDRAPG